MRIRIHGLIHRNRKWGSMYCNSCKHWNVTSIPMPKDYGMCEHPEIDKMIIVGYCDDWDFHKDFGCVLYEKGKYRKGEK